MGESVGKATKLLRFFGPSGGGRSVLAIMSGSLASYVINLASLPIISRLYGPEAFGVFSLVASLASVVVPVATLRLENAALLPREPKGVAPIVWLAVISALTTSALYATGVAAWILLGHGSDSANLDVAAWVFLATALGALFSLFSQLALRRKRYTAVAKRTVYQSLGTAFGQIAAAAITRGSSGLNAGYVFGRTLGIAALYKESRVFIRRTSFRSLKEALVRYWRFPVVFAPSALLNALGLQIPLLFIVSHYGTTLGGQVGMAAKITAIPIALIGTAVGQVLAAEFSHKIRARQGGYFKALLRVSAALGAVALCSAVVIALAAPWFVPLYLGEEWVQAGEFAQILAIVSSLRLVTGPTSGIIILFERSLANSVLDATRVVLVGLAAVVVSIRDLPLSTALWLLYGSLALTHIFTWLYVVKLTFVESQRAERSLPDD